jgi:FemAB-related protein (PEP-CTERM system-associated)
MTTKIQSQFDNGAEWDEYVSAHPDSCNYHRYGWRAVIEKSFGHQTRYHVARNDSGNICGVLPLVSMKSAIFGKFIVSLPFLNYGGILCDNDGTERLLIDESRKWLDDVGGDYIELRHQRKSLFPLETKKHKVTMILDLEQSHEAAWKNLDAKVRNQVRKAEKFSLRAVSGHLELLDGFYEVFCRNMRDLGTPVYSKDFFHNALSTFPDSTRIISVILENKTVASGILTWFKDTLEVPWASSIRDFREMCPNNLLYWEAIKFAINNNSRKFDFGRSTPEEGTYRFKKQWGALPYQLYWQYILKDGYKMPELNTKNPKYELAIKMWKRLPLLVSNNLGPRIVKNIP